MKSKLLLLLIVFVIYGCNQNHNQKIPDQTLTPNQNDSLKNVVNKDNGLGFSIPTPANDTLAINLKMDSANQHITVPINITAGDTLFAFLSSKDKKANIRISQIGFPDSTFDGPFGNSLHYKIKDTGNYKIFIGEDMMAGDRWNGEFTLKTWVK